MATQQTAQASRAPMRSNAEVLPTIDQASPIAQYTAHSVSEDSSDPVGAATSPRISQSLLMARPAPSALPPTPRLATHASPHKRSSSVTPQRAPGPLSNSIRRALRQISAGLTHDEHDQLVEKILSELRPAHLSPPSVQVMPDSNAAPSLQTVTSKMSSSPQSQSPNDSLTTVKRLSARSQSDDSTVSAHGNRTSEDKLSRTPPLSSSRSPTPTTPAGTLRGLHTDSAVVTCDQSSPKAAAQDAVNLVLSPTAALESLRTLENSFQQSTLSLPLDEAAAARDDAELPASATPLAPPTKSVASDREATSSPLCFNGLVSAPRSKRSTSYRKSVPTLDDLATRSKSAASADCDRHQSSSPVSVSSQASLSPVSPGIPPPSWISSLSTSEAIRVLAFQQDDIEADAIDQTNPAAKMDASSNQVYALRYALKYAIARSDKLTEALARANNDKIKAEAELEILRQNVLFMLSSKMVKSPEAAKPLDLQGDNRKRALARNQTSEEEDTDQYEDARSRQGHGTVERPRVSSPKKQVSIDLEPRIARAAPAASNLSRPPRAVSMPRPSKAVVDAANRASAEPVKPTTGVSIASLRKKQAEANGSASSSTSQRYAPPRQALDLESEPADASQTDEDEDDDEFDMYPFHASRRRAAPQVSMSDFLNASRMTKSEMEQHSARRELEREDEPWLSSYSNSSHTPLTGSASSRRGILKGLSKLVDSDRSKRSSRRTSASIISKPSLISIHSATASRDTGRLSRATSISRGASRDLSMTFSEESIIPSYPNRQTASNSKTAAAAQARLRQMSTGSSLRESLEKQSLWEAGIRA